MRGVHADVAVEVFLYGLILVIAGFVGHSQKASVPVALLYAGIIGGIAIAILAALAMRGHRVRTWCIAIVLIIFPCLLTQAAFSWYQVICNASERVTPIVLSMLAVFGLGQLGSLLRK